MDEQTQTATPAPKAARKAPKGKGKAKKAAAPALRRCCKAVFRNFGKYVKSVTAEGNTTADNGDSVAKALRGEDLDDVYKRAAKTLGESVASLKARYGKLNKGMQRMNLGNRIRGAQASKAA